MDAQDRIRATKLDQFRQDIQEGLNSGEATVWNPDEVKQEGRKRQAARNTISHEG
jgi:hypothetical protein